MFTVLTGSQFGDEGKGKIIDLLSEKYDIVVRFQGGDNAGHTVIVGEKKYKLHLIPSGVLYGRRLLIGPGVVLNPLILGREMDSIEGEGISLNLGVDPKTSVIMPYHIELDGLREGGRSVKIGTTRRGIGYAYVDKFSRDEVQVGDLVDPAKLRRKLEEIGPAKERQIIEMGGDPSVIWNEDILKEYQKIGSRLKDKLTDVSFEINSALDHGIGVLAEGAQGAYLDVIHGTQKFVTSSFTLAGSACANLGVGPARVDNVIGVVKAYITRVGEGPLPTELNDETGEHLREKGGEYGTTTGRPRRCGWFDGPLARKSVYLNGYTEMALTKLDVLTGLDPLRICVGYDRFGETLYYPPEMTEELSSCSPIYEEIDGWSDEISEIASYEDLPKEATAYVERLESLLAVDIGLVSVGPGREQTFRKG